MTFRVTRFAPRSIPAVAIFFIMLAVAAAHDARATGTFSPQISATYSETNPGSHPDVSISLSLGLGPDGIARTADDTNDYNFAGIVTFAATARQDADVPDGAILGTLRSVESIAVITNPCVSTLALNFTLMDATTDTNNTVEPLPYGIFNDLIVIAGETPPFDGVADVSPPPAVTQYPSYLNAIFDPDWVDFGPDRVAGNADDNNGPQPPLKPRARSVGVAVVGEFANEWMVRQDVVFEPGTKLPNLPPFAPSLGYPIVTVVQQRSAAGFATPIPLGLIPDVCTPLRYDTLSYGLTHDNPDTAADESGIPLLTLPETGAGLRSIFYGVSQRDADGDGFENSLDQCPLHADTVWNPHTPRTPTRPVPGDSDIFVGKLLGDSIPDTCDPTPTELTTAPGGQPYDHDGDSYANSGDNCPVHYNPDQMDSDVNASGEIVGDGIGDACDTPGSEGGTDCVGEGCAGSAPRPILPRTVPGNGPGIPDGPDHICVRALTISVGGSNEAAVNECTESLPDPTPTPTVTPTTAPPTPTPTACILDDNDFDNDGIKNRRDKDDDNDGIRDGRDRDDDNDGITDRVDRDDDNDGIPDREDKDDGRLLCPSEEGSDPEEGD
jgi:hypothetical protein